MDSLLPIFKSTRFSSPPTLLPGPSRSRSRSFKLGFQQLPENGRKRLVAECGKGVSELKFEQESEWEGIGIGIGIEEGWKGKCNGEKGIVELMECLENEAIMGDDQGNEPADYNRRAQIFHKSSRVFQDNHHQQQPSS